MKKYKVYLNDIEWTRVDNLNIKEDKGWLKGDIVFMETMPYKELSNVRNEVIWHLVSNDYVEEIERLNNIIENMEEELMTIYLDIMEYNEDYAKREIKKLKGVDKE